MLIVYYGILGMFIGLVGIRFSRYRVNQIVMQTVIKVYLIYWIVVINIMGSIQWLNIIKGIDYYNDGIINVRMNTIGWIMVILIMFISSCVIVNSIDYLTIMESYLFIVYISLFEFCMISFVMANDLIITFLNWEWLGLISYLLINFWSSRLNCGIKAVLYNKFGDCFFLYLIAFSYSYMNYYVHLPISILFNSMISYIYTFSYLSNPSVYGWLAISFIFLFFSKSAQFPFSSWLLNAMSAPTPISALLHSSTMVIAGVYLGLIMDSLIILIINRYDWFYIIFILCIIFSLLWTLFKAISLSDIKSITAFSTINQISYMFLALFIFPLLCLFHIIVHALFKSLLFLLAGSLIHTQSNFQSIYRMKPTNSWVKIIYILAGSVLILSLSKESIIHSLNTILSSSFTYILAILGGLFTCIYTLKIYIYCFYRLSSFFSFNTFYSSFILSFLTISSIFIDQSFNPSFSMNSFSLFYSIDFESLLSLSSTHSSFSLIFLFSFPLFFLFLILYSDSLILFSSINSSFDSSSSFFIPPFHYLFLLFSSFIFKAPIHFTESFIGFSSCYSLYQIHYLSSTQLILSFLLLLSLIFFI